MMQVFASTASGGLLADGEKAFMQVDPSARRELLSAELSLEGLTGAPDGSLIRLNREVHGLVAVCLNGGPKS